MSRAIKNVIITSVATCGKRLEWPRYRLLPRPPSEASSSGFFSGRTCVFRSRRDREAICRCASRHAQDRSPCTVTRTTRFASVRADHDRGRVAGQFKSLPGIGDAGAVDLEDGDVLVEVIADQQMFPVGVNAAPSGKPPSSTSSALVTFLPSKCLAMIQTSRTGL